MRFVLLLSVLLLLGLACHSPSPQQPAEPPVKAIVDAYYAVYQARSDFQHFLSFYDEQLVFEDLILGERHLGKKDFAEFFDWNNSNFSKIDSVALKIEEQIVEKNRVVTKGHFTPFRWGDFTFEAMHFTTILTFNEAGKIQRQVDWINYPNNLVDYNKRNNANRWIVEPPAQ
ncbi:MAG: nuclear transport factor 2 family protein [Bacteroidota bacterium]